MQDEGAMPSRKDRKRAEIVAIAQDLFFREGYAGTSMSQIAAAVGGSKATLYNHFTIQGRAAARRGAGCGRNESRRIRPLRDLRRSFAPGSPGSAARP